LQVVSRKAEEELFLEHGLDFVIDLGSRCLNEQIEHAAASRGTKERLAEEIDAGGVIPACF
jgi:hypothetical protein